MYCLAECIRAVAVHIGPMMPSTPEKIFAQLGVTDPELMTWESVQRFGGLKPGTKVCKGDALFPRADIKKELAILNGEPEEDKKAAKDQSKQEKKAAKAEQKAAKRDEGPEGVATYDDFVKIKLIAAKVIACEKVEKSEKLLKETLDVGNGQTRTVCSGIAKHYTPEEMVGKTVVLVANLAPRKMAGVLSEGMLLCAEDPEGKLKLLTVEDGIAPGSEIS